MYNSFNKTLFFKSVKYPIFVRRKSRFLYLFKGIFYVKLYLNLTILNL